MHTNKNIILYLSQFTYATPIENSLFGLLFMGFVVVARLFGAVACWLNRRGQNARPYTASLCAQSCMCVCVSL